MMRSNTLRCLASLMLAISAVVGWFTLPGDWRYLPATIGSVVMLWMLSRPSR